MGLHVTCYRGFHVKDVEQRQLYLQKLVLKRRGKQYRLSCLTGFEQGARVELQMRNDDNVILIWRRTQMI